MRGVGSRGCCSARRLRRLGHGHPLVPAPATPVSAPKRARSHPTNADGSIRARARFRHRAHLQWPDGGTNQAGSNPQDASRLAEEVQETMRRGHVCPGVHVVATRSESDADPLQYNKKLVNIKPSEDDISVTATFEDGTEVTGTALVGSDGHRSVVRRLLLGEEKAAARFAPYTATRIVLRYPRAEQAIKARSLHPINAMAIHPAGIWSWISSEESLHLKTANH